MQDDSPEMDQPPMAAEMLVAFEVQLNCWPHVAPHTHYDLLARSHQKELVHKNALMSTSFTLRVSFLRWALSSTSLTFLMFRLKTSDPIGDPRLKQTPRVREASREFRYLSSLENKNKTQCRDIVFWRWHQVWCDMSAKLKWLGLRDTFGANNLLKNVKILLQRYRVRSQKCVHVGQNYLLPLQGNADKTN